eukprot:c31402_g1_i1 orf=42-191(-)
MAPYGSLSRLHNYFFSTETFTKGNQALKMSKQDQDRQSRALMTRCSTDN